LVFLDRCKRLDNEVNIVATEKKFGAQEMIAAVVSGAIVLIAVVYWVVQIDGVLDMLKLANG
jgi:hypothetical protein